MSCPQGLICTPCGSTYRVDAKTCKALAFGCIDFRFRDSIPCVLSHMGYLDQHDDVILAGSSLGYNGLTGTTNSAWVATIDEQIKIAYDLHKISEIFLIDHMDCGAYAVNYPGLTLNTPEEYELHVQNLDIAAEAIKKKFQGPNATIFEIPNLVITKYVIGIYGAYMGNTDVFTGTFPLPNP